MSATNSLHYQLCCEGARYLIQPRARERFAGINRWSAVEIVCKGTENPDVWAFDGENSTVIEVKTSIADFKNDKKKYCRTEQAETMGHTLGNFRYYLVPEDISEKIKDELPKHWGLLIWNGKKISKIISAEYIKADKKWDLFIMTSIVSRELGAHKIFNYRKN